MNTKDLHYETTNATYKMMATLVSRINNDKFKINKKTKMKNELLFDLQMKIKELFDEINAILSGKKGLVVYGPCYTEMYRKTNFLNCWKAKLVA